MYQIGDKLNRVLVVEDNAELRGVYHRVLSKFYAVSTAATDTHPSYRVTAAPVNRQAADTVAKTAKFRTP